MDPDQTLYDEVRSGAYQISAAVDAIEGVRKTSRDIALHQSGKTQKTLLSVADILDDAGKALADYGEDPPPFAQFKQNFAAQDDRRLKAIDAANEAVDDLLDAQDTLGQLIDSNPPEPINTQLNEADSALDDCVQAVKDAIKAMGGKVASADPKTD
jgi:hypothetical protein